VNAYISNLTHQSTKTTTFIHYPPEIPELKDQVTQKNDIG